MTGGNQLKLAAVVAGTRVRRRGAARRTSAARVVGGTSAGASVVSEHMVAFGDDGPDAAAAAWRSSPPGLGLLPGVVVDQHFGQRDRYGRLLSLVAPRRACSASASTRTPRPSCTGGRLLEVVGRRLRSSSSTRARAVIRRAPRRARRAAADLRRGGAHAARGRTLRPASDAGLRPQRGRLVDRATDTGCAGSSRASRRGRDRSTEPDDPTSDERAPADARHRPDDPGDPRLPRAQHLVVRAGDPPASSTSARSRTTRPTCSPASPTSCSSAARRRGGTPARAGTAAASLERLQEGTWLGHVAEHVALQLQQEAGHDIRRGKTRGHRRARRSTTSSTATPTSGSGWPPASSPSASSTTWSAPSPSFDFDAELEAFLLQAERTAFGPSTQAILDEAVSPRHPVACASTSTRSCSSGRASTSSASAPR